MLSNQLPHFILISHYIYIGITEKQWKFGTLYLYSLPKQTFNLSSFDKYHLLSIAHVYGI